MLSKQDVINHRYKIVCMHSDQGGMGTIYCVTDMNDEFKGKLALKYCKETNEELVKRFKREVRLMQKFAENTKIVQLLDSHIQPRSATAAVSAGVL